MAELRITPGGSAGVISANSVYNLQSQLASGARKFMKPADLRSGVVPITRAVLYDSAVQQMSQLSGRQTNTDGESIANSGFRSAGFIGFADEWSLRGTSGGNITSVMELYLEYTAVGEGRSKL